MGDGDKKVTLVMRRSRALELGLLIRVCGHPANNHFEHDARPCAHCGCRSYEETARRGVTLVEGGPGDGL